jgi:TnpA family transposase
LRRDLCYAHEGAVRHRRHEDQTTQALCLTIVANAIVAWTTEYLALAVAELRASGRSRSTSIGSWQPWPMGTDPLRQARR